MCFTDPGSLDVNTVIVAALVMVATPFPALPEYLAVVSEGTIDATV